MWVLKLLKFTEFCEFTEGRRVRFWFGSHTGVRLLERKRPETVQEVEMVFGLKLLRIDKVDPRETGVPETCTSRETDLMRKDKQ